MNHMRLHRDNRYQILSAIFIIYLFIKSKQAQQQNTQLKKTWLRKKETQKTQKQMACTYLNW